MKPAPPSRTLAAFGIAIGLLILTGLAASGKEGMAVVFVAVLAVQAFCLFRILTQSSTASPTDRMADLGDLHQRGLITDEEFQSKRRTILGEL